MAKLSTFVTIFDKQGVTLHFGLCICNFCVSETRGQFHQHSMSSFNAADPESAKKQSRCQSFLRFWDLCAQKMLIENVDEIDSIICVYWLD